jgi:hypothetical protein
MILRMLFFAIIDGIISPIYTCRPGAIYIYLEEVAN